AVRRRGKWILVHLEGRRCLVFHLGMTGRLTVTDKSEAVARHTHLVFELDDRAQMRFNDIRRFGSATLVEHPADLKGFFAASGLGPEPFELDATYWRDRLGATKRCVKAVLLDQTVVAGIGNIYADESLFEARLHPARLACELDREETDRLR